MPSYGSRRRSRSPRYRRGRSRSRSRGSSRSRTRSRTRSRDPDRKSRQSPRRRSRSRSRDRKSSRHDSPSSRFRGRNRNRDNSIDRRRRSLSRDKEQKRAITSRKSHSRSPEKASKKTPPPKALTAPTLANFDELLLGTKILSDEKKNLSLCERYEKHEINVICMHSKSKQLRSSSEIEEGSKSKSFSAVEMMDLFHEMNPKTKEMTKRPKNLFDREEIKNYKPPVEAPTKVIRLMPSKEELDKLESKFSKGSSRSRENDDKKDRESRSSRSSRQTVTLTRLSEKSRNKVTDADLLDEPVADAFTAVRMDNFDAQNKRSVRDRLGRMDSPENRPGSQRYPSSRDIKSEDLRHNLSSRTEQSRPMEPPLVTDYGHRPAREFRNNKPEDFSSRPDKGKVDPSVFDPTYVPRGRYMEHDDRDSRPRGDNGGRGFRRGPGGRGGGRGPGGRTDRDARTREKFEDRRKKESDLTWKHDKFEDLQKEGENELDRKVEPTSTTS